MLSRMINRQSWKLMYPTSTAFIRHRNVNLPALSSSSSASFSSFSPIDWWKNRQEKKEEEKYKLKVLHMADQEKWTVGDMLKELDEARNSWTAKMPVLKDSKEVQMALKLHKCLDAIASVTSKEATDLEELTRQQKLQAASAAQTTVEEINQVISQFTSMAILHKVLRNRRLKGRKIPETAHAVQTIMQTEGQAVLSRKQKQGMTKRATDTMKRSMRARRR